MYWNKDEWDESYEELLYALDDIDEEKDEEEDEEAQYFDLPYHLRIRKMKQDQERRST